MLRRTTVLRPWLNLCRRPPVHLSSQRFRAHTAKALLLEKLSERFPADYLSNVLDKMTSRKPLDFESGPMVWIDLEMTGLNPRQDKIMEIAASHRPSASVLITNGNLEIVDEGLQYIIRTDKRLLDGMDEWCTNQHGKTGLTQACLESTHSTEFVAKSVLNYIKKWVPGQRTAVLAGNSVHVDRTFLAAEMPEIVEWLHYRIVDVSSIKELARRWYPEMQAPRPAETSHRALDDIRGSIRELKWYRENLFIQPRGQSQSDSR